MLVIYSTGLKFRPWKTSWSECRRYWSRTSQYWENNKCISYWLLPCILTDLSCVRRWLLNNVNNVNLEAHLWCGRSRSCVLTCTWDRSGWGDGELWSLPPTPPSCKTQYHMLWLVWKHGSVNTSLNMFYQHTCISQKHSGTSLTLTFSSQPKSEECRTPSLCLCWRL